YTGPYAACADSDHTCTMYAEYNALVGATSWRFGIRSISPGRARVTSLPTPPPHLRAHGRTRHGGATCARPPARDAGSFRFRPRCTDTSARVPSSKSSLVVALQTRTSAGRLYAHAVH